MGYLLMRKLRYQLVTLQFRTQIIVFIQETLVLVHCNLIRALKNIELNGVNNINPYIIRFDDSYYVV